MSNCDCESCDCMCCNCNMMLNYGKYVCHKESYDITDENDNFIKSIESCNLSEDDPEVNSCEFVQYCNCCNIFINYPYSYDNNEKRFKQKDNQVIENYEYFLENNIIHNFNSIECDHCSSILNKGKFSIENISENQENFDNLSFPIDFIKNLKLFNLEDSFIKEIEPIDYQEYRSLSDDYTTDISRNVLYCGNCNFVILNSLRKLFKEEEIINQDEEENYNNYGEI